jgi:hypothetical protein
VNRRLFICCSTSLLLGSHLHSLKLTLTVACLAVCSLRSMTQLQAVKCAYACLG